MEDSSTKCQPRHPSSLKGWIGFLFLLNLSGKWREKPPSVEAVTLWIDLSKGVDIVREQEGISSSLFPTGHVKSLNFC